MSRSTYSLGVRTAPAAPRSKRAGGERSVAAGGGGSGSVDLSGYMTRREFARYFELVELGTEKDPVTAIHALYDGLYSDGFISALGQGSEGSVAGGDGNGGGAAIDEASLLAYLTEQGYATEEWVREQGYLTSAPAPDLSGYATEEWVRAQGYLTSASAPDLSSYATKDWVSGRGYITSQELNTQTTTSAIRDLTKGLFSRETLERKAYEIQGASEIEVDLDREITRLTKGGILLKSEGEEVEKILMRNDPNDGVQGAATLWKLTQAITAHARELSPERSRELHEISGNLMNRVKLN